jgi:enamine deaminase RidA (YjgF/YER057c/UK114 family)
MVLGKNDLQEQMQNCYTGIDKILKHYGCTFDDVVIENYFTTNMNELHSNAVKFRKKYYKKHYPAGTFIGVKELGAPDMMIEIEIEALIPNKKSNRLLFPDHLI